MIGTGVFTTGGLLLHDLGSPTAVLVAWLVGGVHSIAQRPAESLSGLGTVLLGYLLYLVVKRWGGPLVQSKESPCAPSTF
jgi:ABC-type tungstate transport system substrate-binding protein